MEWFKTSRAFPECQIQIQIVEQRTLVKFAIFYARAVNAQEFMTKNAERMSFNGIKQSSTKDITSSEFSMWAGILAHQ